MKLMLAFIGACASLAAAAPSPEAASLEKRATGAFSCQIDQAPRCCTSFPTGTAVGPATGCVAALGGVGYAKCVNGEIPACCTSTSAAGISDCVHPSNVNLPSPPANSGIAGVPNGRFSCFTGSYAICCANVAASGTSAGVAPVQVGTGCVSAASAAGLSYCANAALFGLCSSGPLNSGTSTQCQFAGLLPRGKPV